MSAHIIEYDDSFAEALRELGEWDSDVSNEWGLIAQGIEEDPFFKPPSPPYYVEQDIVKGECSCQHETGWGGWALYWFYAIRNGIGQPTKVLVFAERADQLRLQPNRKKLKSIIKI